MVHGLLTSFACTTWYHRLSFKKTYELCSHHSNFIHEILPFILAELSTSSARLQNPYILTLWYIMGMSQHIPKYPMPQQTIAKQLFFLWSQTDTNQKWFELCHVAKASEGQCWAHEAKEVNLAAISRQHKTWLLQESLPCRKSLFVFVWCAVWGGKKLWAPLLNN